MAAISFPTAADTPSRTTYTSSPWTDPSGNQWLWSAAKERWSPISETVENAVTDNNTNAVSSNAVFDALALKAPLSGATFTGPITATAITGTTGTFSGNISPTLTNTQSFGSTGLNWNTIWTRNVRSDSGTLILNDGNAAITITSGTLALGNRKLTALRGLEFQTDNTYDIGATSTTLRPRDLFLARNAGIGGNLTATGTVTAGGTNTWNGSTFSGAQAFSGDVSVTDATASTTTTTGALKVAGGLGVVGAVNAGARVTATRGTVGVGTVYTNLSLTDIAGTSTDFLSRFVVGDSITFNTTVGGVTSPETKVITAIASDTSMTTLPFSGPSASGAEAYTHTTASATMNPSGAITGRTGTFSGAVSGTTGFFSGSVTAGGTNNWTGSVFSGAQAFSGTLTVTGNTTVAAATETAVALGTVTSTATIAITAGTIITATLTASTACTFTMPAVGAGKSFTLLLKQAATTGNGTATFTSVKWPAGTAPTVTATAAKMDILTFVSDGTNWYGSIAQNFTP